RIPAPGRSGTPLRPRTPVAQTRTHPRPRRLHRCPSTSRNRPRHPWQLSTRRPTVHPNGTHHENQRTTHHHRRRCRNSTIIPGHRHLKPPSGAAKSRQMKLRVTVLSYRFSSRFVHQDDEELTIGVGNLLSLTRASRGSAVAVN